jgi:hypothetical protein
VPTTTKSAATMRRKAREPRTPRKKKIVLPWYCLLVGWALCILSIAISLFFLWAYAIQFGNNKTYEWLTSLIVSFFSGLILLQPIKVVLIASALSFIFKGVDLDDDDVDEDEEKAVVADEAEWYRDSGAEKNPKVYPIDEDQLEMIRAARDAIRQSMPLFARHFMRVSMLCCRKTSLT